MLLGLLLSLGLFLGYWVYRSYAGSLSRSRRLIQWLQYPQVHAEWAVSAGERCAQAPFLMPTSGYIGYLWGDSFRLGHRHQGIDIFGGTAVGETQVIAAYAGYLTRLPHWKSSLIIRVPQDPLVPQRQIWTYYTHMADEEGRSLIQARFPPGTTEQYVSAGTLLGYQGNFSGNPLNPVGVHLHFSIILDDGQGNFRNELVFENTIDPSPYLGLALNAAENRNQIPVCLTSPQVEEP